MHLTGFLVLPDRDVTFGQDTNTSFQILTYSTLKIEQYNTWLWVSNPLLAGRLQPARLYYAHRDHICVSYTSIYYTNHTVI
jgi:hypothetical protein